MSDYPGHLSLLRRHVVWHFALLPQLSVPGGVLKCLSCIRDEESAISCLSFQGRHEFPPRRLRALQAFLCSHNDVTPGGKRNKGISEGYAFKTSVIEVATGSLPQVMKKMTLGSCLN